MEVGCTYQIDLMSKAFDAYLYLLDDTNKLLAQGDDSGGGQELASSIRAARRPVSHRATSLGGDSMGITRDHSPHRPDREGRHVKGTNRVGSLCRT